MRTLAGVADPKRLTLFFLVLLSSFLVSVCLYLILPLIIVEQPVLRRLLLSLAVFLFTFAFQFILFRWAVFDRLKRIYFSIHNYRHSDEVQSDQRKIAISEDLISDIEKELSIWAEERKAEIDRLKKLETYRKEYLGNVSHELKTPIFNIQGYVLTLLDGGLDDKTINKDYLQRAENSVERMIGIVDDLEAITQLEVGQLELDYEKFDIVDLTREIFKAEEMKATAKGIMFGLKDVAELPVFVSADKFRIKQVMTNLIVNSVKYGKEFGETKVKFYDVGEIVRVEISDNGIGIGENHLHRLFERFYRVDKHRSREQGGTGLGLAIVKHILEAHNQSIQVMSTPGVGSVFSFTLKKAV